MLSDEWLSRYGLLENFNASVTRTGTRTRTGTGTWTTGVTAIALCTSCSRAKNQTKPFYIGTKEAPSESDYSNALHFEHPNTFVFTNLYMIAKSVN